MHYSAGAVRQKLIFDVDERIQLLTSEIFNLGKENYVGKYVVRREVRRVKEDAKPYIKV